MAAEISTKTCTKCKLERPIGLFGKRPEYRDGYRTQCNPCRSKMTSDYQQVEDVRVKRREAYRSARAALVSDPTKDASLRWSKIKTKYGLSRDEYETMLSSQDGACGICRTREPGGRYGVFVVDHCHTGGDVRGLLCNKCNTAIGMLGDTVESAQRVVDYLSTGSISRIRRGQSWAA